MPYLNRCLPLLTRLLRPYTNGFVCALPCDTPQTKLVKTVEGLLYIATLNDDYVQDGFLQRAFLHTVLDMRKWYGLPRSVGFHHPISLILIFFRSPQSEAFISLTNFKSQGTMA